MKFMMPAAVALSMVASVGVAQAKHAKTAAAAPPAETTFYATPMSPLAPTNLPGENLIPGASEAVGAFNAITEPVLQPILAPGGAAAAPAPAPQHRLHRHHSRHLNRM